MEFICILFIYNLLIWWLWVLKHGHMVKSRVSRERRRSNHGGRERACFGVSKGDKKSPVKWQILNTCWLRPGNDSIFQPWPCLLEQICVILIQICDEHENKQVCLMLTLKDKHFKKKKEFLIYIRNFFFLLFLPIPPCAQHSSTTTLLHSLAIYF